jgi:hypothetical protein
VCNRATELMAISPEGMDDDELESEIFATEYVLKQIYRRLANLKDERRRRQTHPMESAGWYLGR